LGELFWNNTKGSTAESLGPNSQQPDATGCDGGSPRNFEISDFFFHKNKHILT